MCMRTIFGPAILGLVLIGSATARADEAPAPVLPASCADGSAPKMNSADLNDWGCADGTKVSPPPAAPASEAAPAEAPAPSAAGNHPDQGDGDNIRLGELSSLGSAKLLSHDT